MKGVWSGASRFLLRSWFDEEREFLDFCAENFDSSKMMRNIIFDNQMEKPIYQTYQIDKKRYDLLIKILDKDWDNVSLPNKIMIYGAGNIGKQFYRMIKNKCEIVAFIDKYKSGLMLDGVSVFNVEEIEFDENVPCVITATYDFESICNELRGYSEK